MAFKSSKVAWVVVAVSLIAVSSFAFLPSSGDPTTFKVSAAGDAYVSTANPTAAYGKDVDVWVSKVGSVENWGYLSFDIASKLPAGVVVVKARLKLLVDQSYGVFPAQTVAGRLLADFNEATLTYNTLEGPVLQVFTLPPGQYGYSISPGEILAVRTSN